MSISHQDVSEMVAGQILTKKENPNKVRPEIFYGIYSDLIRLYKGGCTSPEELASKVGIDAVQSAIHAAQSMNGLGEGDWVKILEQKASTQLAAIKLEKMARKAQSGEDLDYAEIKKIVRDAQENVGANYIPLSEVEPGEVPFIESGWKPIDVHLGGLPQVGLIVVGGNPGVGKTSWMARLAGQFARKHTDKFVAVHSIEMILKELSMRFHEIDDLPKDVQSRILLDETPIMPEDVITRASTIENLGMVFIDFADLMVKGDNSESSMAHIYKTLMIGAKTLRCPVVLLSQLNRAYEGGIPRPHNLRYTGLAEALAWMLIMLYNPTIDYFAEKDEDELPVMDGKGYMICWKVRGGFREHRGENPGAIQIDFKGNLGWRPDQPGKWFRMKST